MILKTFLLLVILVGLTNAQTATPAAATDAATAAPDAATDAPTATPDAATDAATDASTAAAATDAPTAAATNASTAAATTDAATTADPGEAPTAQSLFVTCTNTEMMVTLDISLHSSIVLDRVTLNDANCKLYDYGNANATHLWMRAPFDKCMTNHSTVGDTITYANSLITETSTSSDAAIISRTFQAEFPFKCTYSRSAVVSVASFSPREKVIYTKTAEYGNFTYTMDMYPTDQYEAPYSEYPVRKDLNEIMYLEVKVESNDSNLVLFLDKAWATASPDVNDAKYYVIIEHGCKNDSTLVYAYDKESAVQRFTLQSFRFFGVSANPVVYLHGNVEACRKGDSESRCAKGCQGSSKRKRRDLILEAAQQTVTIGPVLNKEEAAQQKQEDSASSLSLIAAVAGVLAVAVLALTVALVMLYKRHRSPQNAARVVYTKTSNDDSKLLV